MKHPPTRQSGADRAAPHLLYIAWGYPPARGSGVYRAVATANAFVAAGWRVTVVTADKASFEKYTSSDTRLEQLIDPSIKVVRVPFVRPYLEDDLSTWSRVRMEFPLVWGMVTALFDELHYPESKYARWLPAVRRAVRQVHRDDPVDLVMGTANPQVDAAAAAALHPQVPYIVDYRDAWVLDTFTGNRFHSKRSRQARRERRLFANADEIWFVNEPIRAWHAREYPDDAHKMHVVPNGSDLALVPRGRPRDRGSDPMSFVYLGTITTVVPLAPFAEGWHAARTVVRDARVELYGHLGFFEKPSSVERDMVDALLEVGDVEFRGPVSKLDVEGVYANADVLLFLLGGAEYVTSGKLYEYIATGLPIVSVHDPRSAAVSVLRDYPLWFPAASLAPADIAAALEAAYRAVIDPDPQAWEGARRAAGGTKRTAMLAPHLDRLTRKVTP